MKNTLPQDYFDDMYKQHEDPWNFETSAYEHAKYKATIAALPRQRYSNALEIGCSIGVLTEMLSKCCNHLLSTDTSEAPLAIARMRLQSSPNVEFKQAAIPADYPQGNYDLVVMSEVGYYLSADDLLIAKQKIMKSLVPGGDIILVHWLPYVEDYPLTGDEVHELFLIANPHLQHTYRKREEKYRIDVLTKI